MTQDRCYIPLVRRLFAQWPGAEVGLVLDRTDIEDQCSFRAVEVQRYCQAHHWHWQLGLKSDTLFRQGAADWQPLRAIALAQRQRRYIQDVILTQQHAFGPVNLITDWTSEEETSATWSPTNALIDSPGVGAVNASGLSPFSVTGRATALIWKAASWCIRSSYRSVEPLRKWLPLPSARCVTRGWHSG